MWHAGKVILYRYNTAESQQKVQPLPEKHCIFNSTAGFADRTCCVPFCCAATSATNDKQATRIFAFTKCLNVDHLPPQPLFPPTGLPTRSSAMQSTLVP